MTEPVSAPMPSAPSSAITLGRVGELLRERGFRATPGRAADGTEVMVSASSGLGFHIAPGSAASDGQALLDLAFLAAVEVGAERAVTLPPQWNADRRFARMHGRDSVVVLEMDVVLESERHLQTMLEIWDALLRDLSARSRQVG